MTASWNNHAKVVELLLQNGENAELKNGNGATALTLACSLGQLDLDNEKIPATYNAVDPFGPFKSTCAPRNSSSATTS
ncbi:hypothetical protein PF010_g20816 [Phytophthora fragariae]|uniref:Uncharacterized protein n=1 Tax=Phytophthora fragariae TaxID=53985 RepID=A0A6A4CAA1_9STRA|nr:hypothetical protein PF003_g17494 [Phytophthora fragariae]KAE8927367.1 hypothetical protein PF009_g22470 [Phytophthora fragariae]KAE9084474.1 hypothetical protein PF010_g20816 [Phytophthora fragariae]KAE9109231.1 hypothetical protein PF006_g20717 [Phytophthora fragariae]KAE9115834.1 hypothetical protein PF007_g9895 [Phytophthora fragariae]